MKNWHKRTETWSEENKDGRWHKFSYDVIIVWDKTNLDIFWIKDKSLAFVQLAGLGYFGRQNH
ncbi:MAG: hypothetical protein MUP24_15215 [Gillisia sp.]|nr:hypothetical protein [Gillisia sp.]